jgi:glucokinase
VARAQRGGLLGAGSGLGVSGLIPAADGWVALGTEGGHTSFSPARRARDRHPALRPALFPHLSHERLLSGPGLELIHRALRDRAGLAPQALAAPEITRRAWTAATPCAETLDAFCAVLGTVAANLAVTLGALGGIYIGGGIVPRLGEYFDRSPFRARFEDKGRFSDYVKGIPTYVITAEHATFVGASAILAHAAAGAAGRPGLGHPGADPAFRDSLSPAERRVADHVLAHPRSALGDPIAEIARAAQVSQPTVIRFCRTLGCEGLSDFKLRLASGLSATVPVTHTQVTGEDSMLELGVKVLGNTASAILAVRDQLNRDTAGARHRTAGRARAHRVLCRRPLRRGGRRRAVQVPALRRAQRQLHRPALQVLAANVLRPCDVVVVISSSSGRIDDLLAVADLARSRGAAVVAITASHSPLARKADVALIVDHVEDVATHVPMVSRILHLLMIDILAVGVAMRMGEAVVATLPQLHHGGSGRRHARSPLPGHQARRGRASARPGRLATLTSHSR